MEYVIYGNSPLHRYIAVYKFLPRQDNSVEYRSYNTLVTSIPGLTAEFFKLYLDAGDFNICAYLGKTCEFTDVAPLLDDANPANTEWDAPL